MRSFNRTVRSLLSLLLIPCSLSSFQAAEAHPHSDRQARKEFFQLKRTGEWLNYREDGMYVEVVGTQFIGLESAFNESRTCLYGFSQAGLNGPGSFEVRTRFVCFDTDRYKLSMKKEWCQLGSTGCEMDPGGISVGIGNLNVIDGHVPGLDPQLPLPYPQDITVDVHKPVRRPFAVGGNVLN